jgi:hypothetical protein
VHENGGRACGMRELRIYTSDLQSIVNIARDEIVVEFPNGASTDRPPRFATRSRESVLQFMMTNFSLKQTRQKIGAPLSFDVRVLDLRTV